MVTPQEVDAAIQRERSYLNDSSITGKNNEIVREIMKYRIEMTGLTDDEFWNSESTREQYEKALLMGLVRQSGLRSSKAGIAQLGEAVLIVVAIFVAALAWYGLSGHTIDFTNPFDLAHPIWLIVIAQFIGAAGEEIGWRCFLQPTLQTRMGVLLSSVVVGLLWGVWHVGVFTEGWLYASSFILFAVCLSVILGELLRGKRLKLPTATTFHALINLALLLWFKEEGGDAYAMATMAIATLIAAVCVLIVHSVRTGRGTRKSNNTFPELR
ncbi:CPBP family intramembrane metalloprotease [Paenibacillus donghaensis]|uniref:CPBP family intramembrane glutamic endopeptidase n=1 Tax=Paenibacillus donghaensis TaxID=414771 RepID=UPI00188385F9|nr:CPBP family intramembrane glutamic endopeptidase [Paenibacillus donghaensis]MBE9915881.1 CPBP family intramembrane metalloprotease [Paenibacillus donghaensis]